MHVLVQLSAIAVAATVLTAATACKDAPSPPGPIQRPGIDGLVAFLETRHRDPVWQAGCVPMDVAVREFAVPGYADLLARDVATLAPAMERTGAVHARVLYADDPEVPASLRRSRVALPVGQPPFVASVDGAWIPTLWWFRERWMCLGTIDAEIGKHVAESCRVHYLNSAEGRCLDFAGGLAGAVAAKNAGARDRLCALIVAHGCGSVPAEAPPLSQPVPSQ